MREHHSAAEPDTIDPLPQQLVNDLKQLCTITPPIPKPVDAAVRFLIHGHFENKYPGRVAWRRILPWGAALLLVAAIVLLALQLLPLLRH